MKDSAAPGDAPSEGMPDEGTRGEDAPSGDVSGEGMPSDDGAEPGQGGSSNVEGMSEGNPRSHPRAERGV